MASLDDARLRLASDLGGLRAALDEARAAQLASLSRELARGLQPALDAARAAMRATHPGHTTSGSPLADRALAPWDDPAWDDASPSAALAGVGGLVRIGTLETLAVPGSAPRDLPALVPLVCRNNLVLAASGRALDLAHDALQSVVFRLVAAAPPGKVRVTGIDAVGLGSTFAEVLKLPESLRGPKLWHEERETTDALAELSAHMSMVIQKYLKSDYASIDDYNREAGEIAEPYRILLVAGFPAGFRPEAAERLVSIAKNGPPLGVHVLLSLDTAAPAPQGFTLTELERSATVLRHRQGKWEWRDAPRGACDLTLDPRPPRERVDALVAALSPLAARADQVRVPLAPLLDPVPWTGDSTAGIEVPLGRRGARESLLLRFGRAGTAHHALVGGRTGAGKTVLLHALIASLVWRYSPEELELYLVDFKEGVEFQVYRSLPHARVVAIQSEREFGLSVLEGVRTELNRRGDLFREQGVDELAAWRRLTGTRLPRIVVIIDEFQVFFELNDGLAQHARALLTDIASRGRSFGIHLVLASQTLSAMELEARALSQIGVRIALQMSEADSFKVLGKDNDAARFLERPGEAIFNEAGGLPGHNVRFQGAWVAREEREERMATLVARAATIGFTRRPIVFEGARPAELGDNVAVTQLLLSPPTEVPRGHDLYLGEPMTLQPGHLSVRLRRQARGNLLIVGNDEATALHTMMAAALSWSASLPPGVGRVRVLDLTNVDDPLHDTIALLARLPTPTTLRRGPQAEALLTEVIDELKVRREAAAASKRGTALAPPELLIVFGLQRGRMFDRQGLRAPPCATLLTQALAEGPDLGLHTFLWADAWAGLSRALGSAELAELGTRVALNGGDALRALGTQTSPTLRHGTALVVTEDEPDRPQKLRCYGPESARWLSTVLPEET